MSDSLLKDHPTEYERLGGTNTFPQVKYHCRTLLGTCHMTCETGLAILHSQTHRDIARIPQRQVAMKVKIRHFLKSIGIIKNCISQIQKSKFQFFDVICFWREEFQLIILGQISVVQFIRFDFQVDKVLVRQYQ